MGTALTIRDLIGERPIFRREQAVGLSTAAYLVAKIVVFSVFAIVQAAIATAISVIGWGTADLQRRVLGNVSFELFVDVAATCVASALLGMALSAIAQSQDQIMPMLVVVHHVAAGVLRRHDLGDRPARARPVVVGHARPVGFRGVGVDDRHPPADAGPDRPEGPALEPQGRAPGCSTWRCWWCCASSTAPSCGGRSGSSGTELMNQPAQPVLTVRSDRSEASFAAGRDVVVGSDLRADLRVAHPLVARAHLLLRFDRGRWVAVDNNSLNGVFANGQRVPTVDIQDGQSHQHRQARRAAAHFRSRTSPRSVGLLPLTTVSIPIIVPPPAARPRPQPAPPAATRPTPARPPPPGQPPAPPPQSPDAARAPDRGSAVIRPSAATQAVPQSPERRSRRPCGRPDRSRARQRHRHPRRAGVAPPRV